MSTYIMQMSRMCQFKYEHVYATRLSSCTSGYHLNKQPHLKIIPQQETPLELTFLISSDLTFFLLHVIHKFLLVLHIF